MTDRVSLTGVIADALRDYGIGPDEGTIALVALRTALHNHPGLVSELGGKQVGWGDPGEEGESYFQCGLANQLKRPHDIGGRVFGIPIFAFVAGDTTTPPTL